MKLRTITIFNGAQFEVPQCIQRIDHRATHGWQLRYGGTKLFSDHTTDGSGAAASLAKATKELLKRINSLPAPSLLQRAPSVSKTSDLPVGISGPVLRVRRGGRTRDCSLSVLIPRFGQKPRRRTVYIGTENTYTPARFEAALARAVQMRTEAEQAYEQASTKARRASARAHKEMLKASASAPALVAPKAAATSGKSASPRPSSARPSSSRSSSASATAKA